jgi:hypothetical protein
MMARVSRWKKLPLKAAGGTLSRWRLDQIGRESSN